MAGRAGGACIRAIRVWWFQFVFYFPPSGAERLGDLVDRRFITPRNRAVSSHRQWDAPGDSPPTNLRDQVDFAVRLQHGGIRVLVDLAVDRHRHAVLHLLAQTRKALL